MSQASEVLPVGRFSPSPGIWVDRNDKTVLITGAMELYGPEATAARAAMVQNSLNTAWTKSFPDGYAVRCNITVRYRGAGSKAGNATPIEAVKQADASNVNRLGGVKMTLNANEADAFTTVPRHEFGHVIGLKDRYYESFWSKLRDSWGGERDASIPHAGYDKNVMGTGDSVESKNLRDLATENNPNPNWTNDDDQVRAWVTAASTTQLERLSISAKVNAIRILIRGLTSDEDVAAIARICGSVTSSVEASAIRKSVNLLHCLPVYQRGKIKAAFDKMPQ